MTFLLSLWCALTERHKFRVNPNHMGWRVCSRCGLGQKDLGRTALPYPSAVPNPEDWGCNS